ncbi:HAMP domain-containing protein [Sphingomonas sp. SUN019]|uniref:CHASE4 domain-containing protein n=1 Tax=Sphingomonas sp. SUN019 TaxID=2937788 RepID=UPI00216425C2|nr:CHASE4 domain-containing protein [Sphingomonas sp. SUN019]UVO52370.1 HAMP domain-containing protein [Sphingomonas sp. SUN019]
MAGLMRSGRIERLRNPRSLGGRLVLILTAVGVAGAIGITLLLAGIITPNFNQLEAKAVAGHIERTHAALAEYRSKVESAVRDYGDWNDSYDYIAHPTAAFERESFSPLAMDNLDVEGMAYVGNDRRILIARWRGDDAMRRRLVTAIGAMDFARALGAASSTSFYARMGNVVAAVGIARVRRSDGTGNPRGYVLMARQITSRQLSGLLSLNARIDLSTAPVIETHTLSRMAIAVPIAGADRRAVASAHFVVPRDVSVLGRRMLLLAVAGSTLLLLIVLLVLRRVITQLVLKPLNRVETHMQMVRASGSLGLLDEDRRQDEIGSLGRSFNAMLRQLKDLREQLEVQSFALGRSESAVAVMHNVRNALNPVSTIISQGMARTPPIDRMTLDRAAAELGKDDLPAVRRQKLTAFVLAAIEALEAARIDQQQQLGVGRTAMAHVLEIIGQQQANAHERPALAVCDVTDIIAQNATIARYSGETSIAFSFPAHPHPVLANRVILSQVIGNLFANAAEAVSGAGRASGSIAVSVDCNDAVVTVRIRDDGEGFEPGVGATLFQRGFSTRAHKSGGLGLHWCANSMSAMEGGLRLESEGIGRGAVAVLTLKAPLAQAQAA